MTIDSKGADRKRLCVELGYNRLKVNFNFTMFFVGIGNLKTTRLMFGRMFKKSFLFYNHY